MHLVWGNLDFVVTDTTLSLNHSMKASWQGTSHIFQRIVLLYWFERVHGGLTKVLHPWKDQCLTSTGVDDLQQGIER